jgi:hypothetical protein
MVAILQSCLVMAPTCCCSRALALHVTTSWPSHWGLACSRQQAAAAAAVSLHAAAVAALVVLPATSLFTATLGKRHLPVRDVHHVLRSGGVLIHRHHGGSSSSRRHRPGWSQHILQHQCCWLALLASCWPALCPGCVNWCEERRPPPPHLHLLRHTPVHRQGHHCATAASPYHHTRIPAAAFCLCLGCPDLPPHATLDHTITQVLTPNTHPPFHLLHSLTCSAPILPVYTTLLCLCCFFVHAA